jgi:hypothetical protein
MLRTITVLLLGISSSAAEPAFTIYSRIVDASELSGEAAKRVSLVGKVFVEEYAKHNNLEPAPAELAAMRKLFNSNRPADAQQETESARLITEKWIANTVLFFKVNRSLWRKHGGTVVLSAFGFHIANIATVNEIELLERQGQLRFHLPELREQVLAHYRAVRGDGTVEGARAREIFARPLWEPATVR